MLLCAIGRCAPNMLNRHSKLKRSSSRLRPWKRRKRRNKN